MMATSKDNQAPSQGLTEWQMVELNKELGPDEIMYIGEGRDAQPYVPGPHVVHELNRIFNFGGWECETLEVTLAGQWPYFQPGYKWEGNEVKPKRGILVVYRARVRLTIHTDDGTRSYAGAGIGSQVAWQKDLEDSTTCSLVGAHTTAYKGAETDALKRAAAMLGDRFGLNLRDKRERRANGAGGGEKAVGPRNGSRPPSPTEQPDFSSVGGLLNAMRDLGVKGRGAVELVRDRGEFKGVPLEDMAPAERETVYLAAQGEKETAAAG